MKTIRNIYSHSIFYLFAVVIVATLNVGCNGTAKSGSVGSGKETSSNNGDDSQRRFDPLEFSSDNRVIPKEFPKSLEISSNPVADNDSIGLEDPDSSAYQSVVVEQSYDTVNNQAYRLQIFTSKVYGEISRELKLAEEIFDQPIFVDYEVPYFKIRVGSFAKRNKAEEYQKRVKAAGYKSAWVVMVNVNIEEVPLLYEDEEPYFEYESGGDSDDDENVE